MTNKQITALFLIAITLASPPLGFILMILILFTKGLFKSIPGKEGK